ncbi:bifunctional heparan sulfate N-deacetylase/N-sulfotransferase 4-like [Anneissia japonica]|uniref:bifunctional heparan sulfate N-deacetylase/N-sulfotransferase 4-like n=1 Tax=Anneissia japonica TaxID=1529436 RepID=UPI00142573D0|nr:bifunctional heparan sulfate N-deacetylase/N-sulfotransferase 4-like [Anneissia japonica]XP_033123012.1 bifunctional heparan sulfate N-deacetylase/N-sulfotransferase 4-like [Anneissia japonica]XP_033123013.1 bifunctional heparan sulfate N-deacetylase/N-sulfotransferase 4-like [Anneissia japonica]
MMKAFTKFFCFPRRHFKRVVMLLVVSFFALWLSGYYQTSKTKVDGSYHSKYSNLRLKTIGERFTDDTKRSKFKERLKKKVDSMVLVLAEDSQSKNSLSSIVCVTLEAKHFKYRKRLLSEGSLPSLTQHGQGLYSVIIFESLNSYIYLDTNDRTMLDDYCREFNVGIFAFAVSSKNEITLSSPVGNLPIHMDKQLSLRDLEVNPKSQVLRITKAGGKINTEADNWTVFHGNHSTYQPIVTGQIKSDSVQQISHGMHSNAVFHTTAVLDQGSYDGVKRIFFGHNFQIWIHYPLFFDSLHYLSNGRITCTLERYIMVDIDDIFVGSAGVRMVPDDVEALEIEQENLRRIIPGFTFNLGFSGTYFKKGNKNENEGDVEILRRADKFWWFPHMYNHMRPTVYTDEADLRKYMQLNKQFAEDHNIPLNNNYAVAPHHAGVYPVHNPLYEIWKKVWDIQVTSTEEYPHLYPARRRKGFIHKNIKVLPRQTCGLFTHTVFLDKYPGGRAKLDTSIHGGELFRTFIDNQVNIYMTHLSNYGNDRIALYTFDNVINFVHKWTNLKLHALPPKQLADKYFDLFSDQKEPLWTNPCDDKRHLDIWAENKSCKNLPDFLIIGPQKTGTTALYTFLSMHPAICSNIASTRTYEEVQFFSGTNYFRGIDWYLEFFPGNRSNVIFEKSATYFDNPNVPRRAHALLPKAKLITILISPSKRAYSWYQHMRSHNDPVALNYTFYEIVSADKSSLSAIHDLRRRCLEPGKYAKHLDRWMSHYTSNQLLILDGELLKENPAGTMSKVQHFLHIKKQYDYFTHLKYDNKKGFYCQLLNSGRTKCLGNSKGRVYPQMDRESQSYLSQYYLSHNKDLKALLMKLGYRIPHWLKEELELAEYA